VQKSRKVLHVVDVPKGDHESTAHDAKTADADEAVVLDVVELVRSSLAAQLVVELEPLAKAVFANLKSIFCSCIHIL